MYFLKNLVLHRLEFFHAQAVTYFHCSEYMSRDNVICAISKNSDQPAHMRSLIRAFASRLNIL